MTSRYSGPEQNLPSGNGPAYVTHDEFDEFKGNVYRKISDVSSAMTRDARARSEQYNEITKQLQKLTTAQQRNDSQPPISNRFDDLTGRFEIQKKEIVHSTNRRAPVYSGIGAAVAYGIFEGIKLLLQMRGH